MNAQLGLIQKIDSRDKIRFIKNYLNDLRANPELMPIFTLNVVETGLYDF